MIEKRNHRTFYETVEGTKISLAWSFLVQNPFPCSFIYIIIFIS